MATATMARMIISIVLPKSAAITGLLSCCRNSDAIIGAISLLGELEESPPQLVNCVYGAKHTPRSVTLHILKNTADYDPPVDPLTLPFSAEHRGFIGFPCGFDGLLVYSFNRCENVTAAGCTTGNRE